VGPPALIRPWLLFRTGADGGAHPGGAALLVVDGARSRGQAAARRTLVPLGRAHRAALLRSASDEAVGDATGRGSAGAEAWVDGTVRAARRGRRSGHRCDFAVLDGGAACIGVVSVCFCEPRADVGVLAYWVEGAHRGRGHATAAGRRAARFAFDALRARVLLARIRPGNTASGRVLAKLGFRPDADAARYVLAREDLPAPPPSEGDTVLLIRRPQREALQAGLDRRFVHGLITRLMEQLPGTFAGAVAADLEPPALAALGRARAHGLGQDRDLGAFVELALLVSPRFDEHPTLAAVLDDPRAAPGERMSGVLARLTNDVWDEASRLR
jgi:RimJ/RimL family protein N-acetyltransferase